MVPNNNLLLASLYMITNIFSVEVNQYECPVGCDFNVNQLIFHGTVIASVKEDMFCHHVFVYLKNNSKNFELILMKYL